LRIGIAFDLAPTDPALRNEGPDDRFEEFDRPETVEAIAEVIRGEGHEVILLDDGREFLTRVLADPPDFVFNIAEGEGVGRCREARVPAVLEMLGIPYSGSDPLTLAACLDKDVARRLVLADCAAPEGWTLDERLTGQVEDEIGAFLTGGILERTGEDEEGQLLPFRAILKPAFEGSSKGIRGRCIAETKEEAYDIYRRLAADYHQPILIEDFIAGDEVTVGLVGNPSTEHGTDVEILGVMRILPKRADESFIYSLEVKRDWQNQVDYECPARLSEETMKEVKVASRLAYLDLGCRDLARIDFRVRDGVPYFIEANPLPGLAPGTSDLVILARGHGIEYPDLIRRILHAALTRVGLK
jgi:D-alanine-D-alanine ligase